MLAQAAEMSVQLFHSLFVCLGPFPFEALIELQNVRSACHPDEAPETG